MLKSFSFAKPNHFVRLFTTEATGSGTWLPKKRVSRPTMEKIRALAAAQPEVYNVVELSKEFKLSVEGIRRILKSNYRPEGEVAERQEKNRYEAMGERRKEFKTKHPEEYKKTGAWARDQKKENDISTASSSRTAAAASSNWSNDTYLKRNSHDWKKVSQSAQWDNDEKRSRDGDNRSFSRERSYSREGGDDRKSFKRYEDGERKSFSRNSSERSFRRDGDRRSFDRSESDERRPFNRSERDERRSFNRSESDERRSFRRDNGDRSPRSFNRREEGDRPFYRNNNDNSDKTRRSFNDDDRPRRSFNNREDGFDRTHRFPTRDNDRSPRRSYRDDTPSKDE